MKQPKYKGKELLPLSVIDAARDGDAQAVDSVLRYYEGYINKLCTRTLYDPDGQPRIRVDIEENNRFCRSVSPIFGENSPKIDNQVFTS